MPLRSLGKLLQRVKLIQLEAEFQKIFVDRQLLPDIDIFLEETFKKYGKTVINKIKKMKQQIELLNSGLAILSMSIRAY